MDYSQLSDDEINNMVGRVVSQRFRTDYCNDPGAAWPIIQRNGISLAKYEHGMWLASQMRTGLTVLNGRLTETHPNPLRAAMIVFLMMQESQHA
ncbi:DUF2591 family protein [Cronobacter sakazakii]|uniref:phage protein NinX family protein n=1 Tax=Cronobacter sakazakii TaxID=28141 RepID=UPI0018DC55FD|nr:phage protein NinX family protein [Cronobacter sakazakii]MBI0281499.1 DUF2591 family protein [Cronobacter sakazakii]